MDWLNAYLLRSDRRGYGMEPTEADDLIAVGKLLRSHKVPVAALAAS